MSLETRARSAAEGLRAHTPVDVEDGLHRLHHTRRRRTVGKLIAATTAIALAIGVGVSVAQDQLRGSRTVPPVAPPTTWVLVSGDPSIGTDVTPPRGDEWSRQLAEPGDHVYPFWTSVDPATRRFLVIADEGTALEVMTPGQAEPLVRFPCRSDSSGCLGASLGPGPDEITIVNGDFELEVVGPDGASRGEVGPAWTPPAGRGGFMNGFAWSPNGEMLAEAHHEHDADEARLTLVLRDARSAEETTVYEHVEAAPPWYDAEEHRFADGPGAFNGWDAPMVVRTGLQWSPDSDHLAFVTASTPTTPAEGGRQRSLRWQLFVADMASGDVEQVADLGRCDEPVDERGGHDRRCDAAAPSMAWTPDGRNLTVLWDGTLATYDLAGTVLSSEATTLEGPLAWVATE